MAAAGATVDVILAAVEAELLAEGERVQARRVIDAERQRRKRHAEKDDVTSSHAESRYVTRSHADAKHALTSLLSSTESITKKVESKKERARKTQIPDGYTPNDSHRAKVKAQGKSEAFLLQKVDDMVNWAKSKAIMRADWDATLHNFLKPSEMMNGHRSSNGARQSNGADFFSGLAEAAKDIARDSGMAGHADETIPVGRVNLEH